MIYNIIFITDRIWSFDNEYEDWIQKDLYLAPSDGSFRVDLKAIATDNMENAQNYKEEYENQQRSDKKLREANK